MFWGQVCLQATPSHYPTGGMISKNRAATILCCGSIGSNKGHDKEDISLKLQIKYTTLNQSQHKFNTVYCIIFIQAMEMVRS